MLRTVGKVRTLPEDIIRGLVDWIGCGRNSGISDQDTLLISA